MASGKSHSKKSHSKKSSHRSSRHEGKKDAPPKERDSVEPKREPETVKDVDIKSKTEEIKPETEVKKPKADHPKPLSAKKKPATQAAAHGIPDEDEEELPTESDLFWQRQAAAWVSNNVSSRGPSGLMSMIATQAASQMAENALKNQPSFPMPSMMPSMMPPMHLQTPNAPNMFSQMPVPPPPKNEQKGDEYNPMDNPVPLNESKKPAIPQWLKDAVKEVNSKKKSSEVEKTEAEDERLLTPSPSNMSPRELSPKRELPLGGLAANMSLGAVPIAEQIKRTVAEILTSVTEEVFSEVAREAIRIYRRKQRITSNKTIGLKLSSQISQTPSKIEGSAEKLPTETKSQEKRTDEETNGFFNLEAVTSGAYRCPSTATPPPAGTFSIIVYEEGIEIAKIPFNAAHLIFGSSPKLANIIDTDKSVANQQCSVYFTTTQLLQQGGCFFIVPIGGTSRLLYNKQVPFLPSTIKAALGEKGSRKSISSYISKEKAKWKDWEPSADEGVTLNSGEERVALNENRSCFVLGNSRRTYYIDLSGDSKGHDKSSRKRGSDDKKSKKKKRHKSKS